eukprot:scaffold200694_cov31-Tisochrysis_lutea.AAC.3
MRGAPFAGGLVKSGGGTRGPSSSSRKLTRISATRSVFPLPRREFEVEFPVALVSAARRSGAGVLMGARTGTTSSSVRSVVTNPEGDRPEGRGPTPTISAKSTVAMPSTRRATARAPVSGAMTRVHMRIRRRNHRWGATPRHALGGGQEVTIALHVINCSHHQQSQACDTGSGSTHSSSLRGGGSSHAQSARRWRSGMRAAWYSQTPPTCLSLSYPKLARPSLQELARDVDVDRQGAVMARQRCPVATSCRRTAASLQDSCAPSLPAHLRDLSARRYGRRAKWLRPTRRWACLGLSVKARASLRTHPPDTN